MNKHILVLERNYKGHRLTGVRVLIDALLEFKKTHGVIQSITLATTQAGFESVEFEEQLSGISGLFKKLPLAIQKHDENTLSTAWTKVQDWREHVCSGAFDHVYIPYGDGLLQMLSVAKFIPGLVKPPKHVCIESIFMRGSFGYEQAKTRTKAVALFGLRHAPVDRVHLIDPLPFDYIQKHNPALLEKIRLLPDPITPTEEQDKEQAQSALGLEKNCLWIGCIGVIDDRKGADKLLNAFTAAQLPDNARLLLAGKHSQASMDLISTLDDPRIVSINRYLSEHELNQALGALDIVATPYPNFVGSASIVLRAAAGKRFCLGANSGWMKQVIPAFGLGAICNVCDNEGFSKALQTSLTKATQYQPTQFSRDFVAYGSIDNVNAHWTDLLRLRAGIKGDSRLQPWPKQMPLESVIE